MSEIEQKKVKCRRNVNHGSKSRSRSRCNGRKVSVESASRISIAIDEEICNADGLCYIPTQTRTESRSISPQNRKQFPATPIPEDWEAERIAAAHHNPKSNPFIPAETENLKQVTKKISVCSIKQAVKKSSVSSRKSSCESMRKFSSIITPSFPPTMLSTNSMMRF